jgi:hypothetical protein
MDTILGIPLGERYSGIRVLADLSVCFNKYQQKSKSETNSSAIELAFKARKLIYEKIN